MMPWDNDEDSRAFRAHDLWVADLDAAQERADWARGNEQGPLIPNDRDRLLLRAMTLPAFTEAGAHHYSDVVGYVNEQVQVLVRERAAAQQ